MRRPSFLISLLGLMIFTTLLFFLFQKVIISSIFIIYVFPVLLIAFGFSVLTIIQVLISIMIEVFELRVGGMKIKRVMLVGPNIFIISIVSILHSIESVWFLLMYLSLTIPVTSILIAGLHICGYKDFLRWTGKKKRIYSKF